MLSVVLSKLQNICPVLTKLNIETKNKMKTKKRA